MALNMDDAGILSRIKLSEDHTKIFLTYIRNYLETDTFDILDVFFTHDFMKFLDTFSGQTINIPKRKDIYKIVFYVNVYNYLKSRKFTEDAYNNAASIFNKQKHSLKRIVIRVEKVLNKTFSCYEPEEPIIEDDCKDIVNHLDTKTDMVQGELDFKEEDSEKDSLYYKQLQTEMDKKCIMKGWDKDDIRWK